MKDDEDDEVETPPEWDNLVEVSGELVQLLNNCNRERGFVREEKRTFRDLVTTIGEVLEELATVDGLEDECMELITDTISML